MPAHNATKPSNSDDVNVDTSIAKCRACHAVFNFTNQVQPTTNQPVSRSPVEMPKGFTVDDLPNRLSIKRRWFSPMIIGLLVFVVFWDGFLVFWYGIAFSQDGPLMMKLFPLIHVAVGLGLTYFVAAGFVNHTTIEVDVNQLTVRHAPLPWPGNKQLVSASVDQLYCKEKVHHGKHGVNYTYQLHADVINGKPLKLVSGLTKPEQALFLEQQLEKWLGITDRAVAGELNRS